MLEAYAKPYGLGIGLKHWPRSAVNNNKLTGLEVIKLAELEKFSFNKLNPFNFNKLTELDVIKLAELEKFSFNKSKPFTLSQLNFVELPQLN